MASYSRWGGPRRTSSGGGSYHVFGLTVARPVAWLILLTVGATGLGSLLQRNLAPVLAYMILIPDRVLHGEVWRLVTWTLIEPNGLNLIFGCFLLYVIGPDLVARWGARRFLALYFGGAAIAGAVTCLVGKFVWWEVFSRPHFTMWAMGDALLIAWATYSPDRGMRMFFVLPVSGRNLVAFTIVSTFVYALIDGFPGFVPHFAAELLALVYTDVISVRRFYLRGRMAMLQRDYKRRTAHLHMVDREKDPREPPRWMH